MIQNVSIGNMQCNVKDIAGAKPVPTPLKQAVDPMRYITAPLYQISVFRPANRATNILIS